MGHYHSGTNLTELCTESREIMVILTELAAKSSITKEKELCREPETLWGFASLLQSPQ